MYTGLCQGAATRRNRYLRAAHRVRDIIRRYPDGLPVDAARGLAQWELQIDGVFYVSDETCVAIVTEALQKRLAFCVAQARLHHREWKKWTARNREWRNEMAALDNV